MRSRALCGSGVLLFALGCSHEPVEEKRPPPPLPGYTDCDGVESNGAETNTQADPGHCGACKRECRAGHGSNACVEGACKPTCEAGFAACGAPDEGCATNLAISRLNCSRCESPCSTGYCREGSCVEPKTLATSLVDGTRVAFTVGQDVYTHRSFLLPVSSAAFWKVPLAGGKPTRVTVPGMYPWVTDGKHWYGCKAPVGTIGSECRVSRAPVAGGHVEELAVVKDALMNVFAVDDALVYVGIQSGHDSGAIVAVPIEGGAARTVIETGSVASIAAVHGDLYWSSSGSPTGIFALPKGATKPLKLADALSFDLAVADGYLYFEKHADLDRVPRGGGTIEWLASAGPPSTRPDRSDPTVAGIAVASGVVYFGVDLGGTRLDVRQIDVPKVSPAL